MSNIKCFAALCAIFAVLSAMAGCSKQTPADQTSPADQIQVSQADYSKNGKIGRSVHQTHTISDSDLDWTLNYLKGAKNSLVRTRAMTILAQIHPMSDEQKAKIGPAVEPYLNSDDALEKSAALKVKQWL